MNEDNFNMEIRKFLKKVGISSQREIYNAVKQGIEENKLAGNENLPVAMKLSMPDLDLELEINGDIALD